MVLDKIESLWDDVRERFLNFETIGGIYFIGAGIIFFLNPTFIQTWVIIGLIGYGLYTMLVNRIKKQKKEEELLSLRKAKEGE